MKIIKTITLILTVFITFVSCEKENSNLQIVDENSISLKQATNFATHLNITDTKEERLSFIPNTIKNSFEFKDNKNRTCLYLINFDNNKGWVILSGDKRCRPLLAHSDNGYFDFNSYRKIPPLLNWIESSSKFISNLKDSKNILQIKNSQRTSSTNSTVDSSLTWSTNNADSIILTLPLPLDDHGSIPYNPEYYSPTETLFKRGPLLGSLWSQQFPYNYSCPMAVSNNNEYGKRSPTGCVATAIAQVMYKWKYPSNYNWAIMPTTATSYAWINHIPTPTAGEIEMARLIKDIGSAINMHYSTNSSWAMPFQIKGYLVNKGYSGSIDRILHYDYLILKNELNVGRPVIMSGAETAVSGGHCWVVDGMWEYSNGGYLSWNYQHMNWGWDGNWNGWYDPISDRRKITDDGYTGDDHYESFDHLVSMVIKIYKP